MLAIVASIILKRNPELDRNFFFPPKPNFDTYFAFFDLTFSTATGVSAHLHVCSKHRPSIASHPMGTNHATMRIGGETEAGSESSSGLDLQPQPQMSADIIMSDAASATSRSTTNLFLAFTGFVISGTLFTVTTKIQAEVLYNYPNFVNVFGCVLFVPLCFMYIIPAARTGMIPAEQLRASKVPFAVMAAFDTLASTMQVFAAVYLSGPLLVLLPQASIPISMVMSSAYLGSTYCRWQYLGAIVVVAGIAVVLEPVISNRYAPDYACIAVDMEENCVACQGETDEDACRGHGHTNGVTFMYDSIAAYDGNTVNAFSGDGQALCEWRELSSESSSSSTLLFWAGMMLLSCVPQTMSSIYKEQKLAEMEFDAIFLNGWLCFFQTPLSALLGIPGGLLTSPPVQPRDLPQNFVDGFKCFLGKDSVVEGCNPDDCRYALLAMCGFTIICFIYINLMVLLIKYSSANTMFLAMTMVVPLANLAFALPILPHPVALQESDLVGLAVIMAGIVSYQFGSDLCGGDGPKEREVEANDLVEPLLDIEEIGLEVEVDKG